MRLSPITLGVGAGQKYNNNNAIRTSPRGPSLYTRAAFGWRDSTWTVREHEEKEKKNIIYDPGLLGQKWASVVHKRGGWVAFGGQVEWLEKG